MGDISEHFSRSEFKCNCHQCDCDTVDTELLVILEIAREHFKEPITVTSGHRCAEYNRKVGGATSSYHAMGRAADIKVANVEPAEVYRYLDRLYHNAYGIGKYSSFTHIDTRNYKARW